MTLRGLEDVMMNGLTLPAIARSIPECSLDVLRGIVRKDATLRSLGTMYGPTKVYAVNEVAAIRDAYVARQNRMRASAVTSTNELATGP